MHLTDGTWASLTVNGWGQGQVRPVVRRAELELEDGAPESAWFVFDSGPIKPTVSF